MAVTNWNICLSPTPNTMPRVTYGRNLHPSLWSCTYMEKFREGEGGNVAGAILEAHLEGEEQTNGTV